MERENSSDILDGNLFSLNMYSETYLYSAVLNFLVCLFKIFFDSVLGELKFSREELGEVVEQ